MNWKELIAEVAPAAATVLGGPLAGGAVAILAKKLLGKSSGDIATDEKAIADLLSGGMTPEIRAKLIEADTELKREVVRAETERRKIDADLDRSYLSDVQDARKTHGNNSDVLTLGIIILIVWSLLTGATLYGLFLMLTGGIQIQDVGIVATVFTVLGSTVGYVSNIAQQVVGFFFGSSRGSDRKTTQMAEAFTHAAKR